eukprot:m.593258 g.593258  ORF g.593258 m.593258 type:complete len:365 (-) comp22392_c0_seq9:328-1422(-)
MQRCTKAIRRMHAAVYKWPAGPSASCTRLRFCPPSSPAGHRRPQHTQHATHTAWHVAQRGAPDLVGAGGVVQQRDVRRQHHGALPCPAVRPGCRWHVIALGPPLVLLPRTLVHLPVLPREQLEVAVVPRRRICGPRTFKPAGVRVDAAPRAALARPRVGRVLFRRRPRPLGTCPVCFPKSMSATNECNRLRIIHGHPPERIADVENRQRRIRIPHGALGIQIDQPDSGRSERRLAFPVCGAGCKRSLLRRWSQRCTRRSVRVVDPASTEPKHRTAHAFNRYRSCQNEQISPRQPLPILLFDRPQQMAGLVEIGVVLPAALGVESLSPTVASSAPIGGAVRSRAVPCQAHEQRSIIAVVCWPIGL